MNFANPDIISLAFACAVTGWVYVIALTEPGHILSWWYQFWERLLAPRFEWLFKPIVGCERCVTGQFSLWIFFFYNKAKYHDAGLFTRSFFDILFHHVYCILLSILIVMLIQYVVEIIKAIIQKLKR